MRTSLVVALLPGFSHCGERYILLCNFFQIVYFVRIFYLLLIFSYQHVFWAPILSPQLLGRITFGKITLDFSDTRFCANLRSPGAYRPSPRFHCLLVLLALTPGLLFAHIICSSSPACVFAHRRAFNPHWQFFANPLFRSHFLPFAPFLVPTHVLDSYPLPSTFGRDNFRKNHVDFPKPRIFVLEWRSPVRTDHLVIFDSRSRFWHPLPACYTVM